MKGVILAAGRGSRLFPVTHQIAKPLLPLANRMTIEYAFDQMQAAGIREVAVVVGENHEQMKQALGSGAQFGLDLGYVRQEKPLGLANAVEAAGDFISSSPFMLYLGDAVYGAPITPMVDAFREGDAAAACLVKPVEDPRRFGVATIKDGRIVKLVEKPAQPESNMAMAGAYVFGPELRDVLPELQPSARGEYEITDAIQMLVDRGQTVLPSEHTEPWFDTGTLPSFLSTSRHLTNSGRMIAPDAHIEGEIGDHVVIGEGAHVRCDRVEDSVILPGANVTAGEIKGCLAGGSVSGESLQDSICWDDQRGPEQG